jgi:hypothetical protein
MKVLKPAFVVEATVRLGYPESKIVGIGVVLIACTVLYAVPQTSVLGAILLTGYLGGAVATRARGGWFVQCVVSCCVWRPGLGRSLAARRSTAEPAADGVK